MEYLLEKQEEVIKITLKVRAMFDDRPIDIQSQAKSSTTDSRCYGLNRNTEKLTKSTTVRNDSSLKSFGERKIRERSMTIARGHQMFKNIESALSDGNARRKSVEQGKKKSNLLIDCKSGKCCQVSLSIQRHENL